MKFYEKHPLHYINWRLKGNIVNALLNTHEAVLMGLKRRTLFFDSCQNIFIARLLVNYKTVKLN